jgi:peptidoglycan/LPS O-acetylase OafA/YrhL
MNVRATRFPLFDSLRAIGALAVFGTHAYYILQVNADGPLRAYAARLDVGVYIFFVVSGFLLYRPFVRARLRTGHAPATRAYAWRRLLRIGPAYWVALTVVALWLGYDYVFESGNAVWLYTFGQSYKEGGLALGGLNQAWSLSVEVAFYVMLPVYALVMRSLPVRGERPRLQTELAGLAALVVLGIGFTIYAAETGTTSGRLDVLPLHLTLPCFLHVFAAGMCLAVLSVWYEQGELPAGIRPLDRFPAIAWGVALFAFWVVSTQIGFDGSDGEQHSTAQWAGKSALYALIGLALVTPAVFGDQTRGLVRRLLANRVLLWIGLVSYSLFLYHLAVVTQLGKWNVPARELVALVLSLAIAAVSYYVIERPALRLKRLVKDDREPPPGEAIEEPAPPAPPAQARA